jgi:hypothetical protein
MSTNLATIDVDVPVEVAFLCLDLEPTTAMEHVADQLGVVRRRLQTSLEEFKQNVEARPTGVQLNASYAPYA